MQKQIATSYAELIGLYGSTLELALRANKLMVQGAERVVREQIDLADAAGFEIRTTRNPDRRGGTVTVNPSHSYEVSREVLARDILIDYRPNAGIRISPHFYNTDEEVCAAMEAIEEILEDGSWRKHTRVQL